ncbi:hypothetical protein AA21952_1076 [Acetobacter oeni LMG 21952]|nr:hypothetical protein AA21952_1076 [Acetobacter oeni LMG 21952]
MPSSLATLRETGPLARLWQLIRQSPDRFTEIFGLFIVIAVYIRSYWHNQAVPCAGSRFPQGWWGWFDQSNYLKSALAFSHSDLTPDQHWYPFGYSLMGALFASFGSHLYFLPDLLCLIAAGYGFISFARACGVRSVVSVPLFLLATCGSASLRAVWAEPWNTTLSAALIWNALNLATRLTLVSDSVSSLASSRTNYWRFLILGALLAAMPVTRPTDLLIAGETGIFMLLAAVILRKYTLKDFLTRAAFLISGAAILLGPCFMLYLSIYGMKPSQYMIISRELGFRLEGLWWKTYILLITPRPWFPDGVGLMQRLPWIAPGIAAIVALPLIVTRRTVFPLTLLSVLIVTYSLLFFSYVDLIPGGLWLYNNVHYFKWLFPGLTLLGYFAVHAIIYGSHRRSVLALILMVYLITCVRLLPAQEEAASGPEWMVQIAEKKPRWEEAYFGPSRIQDMSGTWRNINDYRGFPDSQGVRWIALAHPFSGAIRPFTELDGKLHPVSETGDIHYWKMHISFRLNACWLPPYACDKKSPRW